MEDKEIYSSETYKTVNMGLLVSFVSGIACGCGGLLFFLGIDELVIGLFFVISLVLFMSSRFIGLHTLFPNEEEQNGD